ncbi:uncharacterized protein LOC143030394 [Oratosquilla oratoria]|uniref:uncharacterized protein LOC143030394 n=1 Tax=Oratosquilla oratoria TaxID=337810 RepID=UPI003F770497
MFEVLIKRLGEAFEDTAANMLGIANTHSDWLEEDEEEVDNPEPRESLTEEGVRKQKTTKAVVWKDITRVLQELITGVELRQVEGKWRNLKSIFHHYEDYKKASGRGKKTEPRFYNLLSSILKNHPLSQPDLCVLEGTEVGTRSVAEMEVDNPVEEDPATQASLLDPQHGEASQCAPTPPQASPPDPQPAHASQAPQPAPATREEPPAARGNVPPPRRTRTRSLRPSADRKELLLCVKYMKNTLKTSSDKQQNSMAELKELLSCIADVIENATKWTWR